MLDQISRTRLRASVLALSLLFMAALTPYVLAQATQIQYLSGVDKDHTVPWNFLCTAGRNANVNTTIPVPSNWTLQGFGTFSYQGGSRPATQGRYSTTFMAPASWAGQRIILVFEGVETDTSVTVNGTSASLTLDGVNGGTIHQGGFYRFQYDVSSLVKFGQSNTLAVTVDAESANASINNAERNGDYWNFEGIFRPVYLEAFPAQSIDRVAVNAKADGTFAVDAYLAGVTTATSVVGQIQDLSGNPVGAPFSAGVANGAAKVTLATTITSPRLWTAETPNLYNVVLKLQQGATVLHTVTQRFGFRTMELRVGDGFYVNGKRVLLKGSDRHSFWPDSGRCLSDAISRLDIGLMKGMNMNAVRMSHYPPDQHFLDDCDELGIYVLDELGGWQHAYDTTVGTRLVKEMVIRDVNHPSILIWDNANEGGWNTAIEPEYGKWDPQNRPVNHPQTGGLSNPQPYNNILDAHYQSYSQTQTYASGSAVYMPTEFLHAQYDGGGGAGLADYWDVFRAGSVTGGGFIWAFLDESVKRVDQTGTPLDSSGGSAPDGILGPYRQLEGSAFTIKEVWSPVVFTDAALPSGSSPTLHVDNRYDFLNLQQCSFVWELRQFPRPRDTGAGAVVSTVGTASTTYNIVAQGTASTGSVPAHTSGTLTLSLPSPLPTADALAVRALDPAGNEVWTRVWTLPAADSFRVVTTPANRLPVTAVTVGNTIQARSGDLTVTISTAGTTAGQVTAVNRAGHAYSLTNGPRLVTGTATFTGITRQASSGGDMVITANYTGNLQKVVWTIQRSGWVRVDSTYSLSGAQNFFGVGFTYPEASVQSMRWLGDGPFRTYKNRRQGAMTNVWQNAYNNTSTGSITNPSPTFQPFPEFKGYYGNVRWAQFQTNEGLITAVLGADNQFLQVFTPTVSGANLAPYPSTSLSFLDAIPAMGSKFGAANTTGPAGQPAVASGAYTDSVSFYFGALP